MTSPNPISSDEARKKWSQVLQRAHWGAEHISVTLHGKPHVRIVSEEWYRKAEAALKKPDA